MIKKTLYFGNPAYLSLRMEQMVIKLPEVEKNHQVADVIRNEAIVTRPIEDIGLVVLDNKQITITQGLLEALLENNCAIVTCDSQRMPVGLMLPLCGNTIQSERFQDQISASQPLRKQLWQQTIKAKIDNQARVLSLCSQAEVRCMSKWSNDVKSGDADNQEARAAAYYWKNFFSNISGLEDFTRARWHATKQPPQLWLCHTACHCGTCTSQQRHASHLWHSSPQSIQCLLSRRRHHGALSSLC